MAMPKKSVSRYQNPLDLYLSSESDDYDHFAFLARQFKAEPFDANGFKTELVAKLNKYSYGRKQHEGDGKTFHEILTDAGALDILLEPSMLSELRRCILMKNIGARDRELQRGKKAFDGTTLHDHNKEAKQIIRELNLTEQISDKYKNFVDFEKLWDEMDRQYRRHLRFILSSTKYRASRSVFLTGRVPDKRTTKPKNEDVATKVAIYRTLQQKLQTHDAKTTGLSDRVLRQLAELVFAASTAQSPSDGQNLYRAAKRASRP
jgi:hypothetical protein